MLTRHIQGTARAATATALLLALAIASAACGATTGPSGGSGTTGANGSPAGAAGSGVPTASGGPGGGTGGSPGTPGEADPAASLRINQPFGLATLPAATADTLQATFTKDLGAFGKAVRVGARAVTRDGSNVGFVLAVGFPRQTLDATTYADAVATLEAGAEQSFAKRQILNVEVTTGTIGGGEVGLFRVGDTLVIVLGATSAVVVPIVTALINANG